MPRQIEAGLQEAVVRYLRLMLRDCVVYHTPNGGKRSFKTAKLMKRIGTFSGVFDLTILAPVGRAFFMEIKQGKGRLSEEQEAFRLALIRMGHPYCIVRSLDDAILALETWGLTKRSVCNAVDNGDGLFGNSGGQDGTAALQGGKKRMGLGSSAPALQSASTTKAESVTETDTRRHTSPIRPTRPNT
jgi:hypothetical protein